jgi:dTDP-4-amino-4,6-dideoxygalactose transaminase
LEQLDAYIAEKRQLAADYAACLAGSDLAFVTEAEGCRSNYWLNAVICPDRAQRDQLLQTTNKQGIMTRPIWQLMNRLPMYASAPTGELPNALWLEARVVNLPSSIRAHDGGET